MTVRVLASGVDSVYATARAALRPATLAELEAARNRAQFEDDEVPFEFAGGTRFLVRPYGKRGWRYWLSSPDYELFVSTNESEKFPTVQVQLHSAYLHSCGVELAVERVTDLLCSELLDAYALRLIASRVDLYADVQPWELGVGDLRRFVSMGRWRRGFLEHQEVYMQGRRFTGFVFGKGKSLQCRIYDKTTEIGRRVQALHRRAEELFASPRSICCHPRPPSLTASARNGQWQTGAKGANLRRSLAWDHGAVEAIIDLERVVAAHWRGTEQEWLGGGLLRAADGFTGRANSALPLGDPGLPLDDALAAVTGWYRARRLPPMIAVPLPLDDSAPHPLDIQLSERCWPTRPGPAYVMTADVASVAAAPQLPQGAEFRVDDEPDDAWLAMYHYRGQERHPPVMRSVLMSAQSQAFASIRCGDGRELLAIGRLSIADGWAGITAVEVSRAHRRAGLGTALTSGICVEAARRGVGRVILQVETSNTAAMALYERCGFAYSHRYHYRIAP